MFATLFGAPAAFGQQNLFNVPSGNITKKDEAFFQQQFNFTKPAGTSNTTVDFGLGHGWEAGFNILDLDLYRRSKMPDDFGPVQSNPDLLANVQKGFELTEFWDLGIGTQFGFNPARQSRDVRFQNFTWAITGLELPGRSEFGKFYFGAYYANVAYSGAGDRGGFLLGYELPIVKDRFSFQADWVGGNNEISVVVIGGVYTFTSGWQLSLGAQLPTPRSRNDYGLVIELTCPGYKLPRFRKN